MPCHPSMITTGYVAIASSCMASCQGTCVQMHEVTERMLETAARRSAGCPLAAARLTLAFDGSAAAQDQMADVHLLFSPASGADCGSP